MMGKERMIYLFAKYRIEHRLNILCDIPKSFCIQLPCDIEDFLPTIDEEDFDLTNLLKGKEEVAHIIKDVVINYNQRTLETISK